MKYFFEKLTSVRELTDDGLSMKVPGMNIAELSLKLPPKLRVFCKVQGFSP